jgi:hypothetical protein
VRVTHRPDNLLLQYTTNLSHLEREFLIGLKTFFFNPKQPLSPGERVAHNPDNLRLQLHD